MGPTTLRVRIRSVVGYLILESDHVVFAVLRAPIGPLLERALDTGFKLFVRLPRQYEQVMRYFTPLFPAREMRQSKTSSKSRKVCVLKRSSLIAGLEVALRQPSSMVQASPGGVCRRGSTQPFMDFPSNSRTHPADFS